MGGQPLTKKLSHEGELVQVAGTPGANDEVQFELQPLANTKRTVHRFRHQGNHVPARFERSKQPSSEGSFDF